MRIVVFTGSRGWQDGSSVFDAMEGLKRPFIVVVGDAKGYDQIVWEQAGLLRLPRLRFKAKWHDNPEIRVGYDRFAGHKRNRRMLKWAKARDSECFVMAGWDGTSTGTKGCMDDAERLGMSIWRINSMTRRN